MPMLRAKWIIILPLLCATSVTAGQLYRWVDERGVVHYSDQSPPPKARQVESLRPRANVVEVDKEGYETKRARETNPVLLYVTDCGEPCDLARAFLDQRKIPYSRKNPQTVPEDAVELKRLAGALEVPVIQVGSRYHKGFDPAAWEALLITAGYPMRAPAPRP